MLPVALLDWLDSPVSRAPPWLGAGGAVGLRQHFSTAACSEWVRGTYEARSLWTSDFGGDQFSLGRAFYTHLEQGRTEAYFADAVASDARVEAHLPGLQQAMRTLAEGLVGGQVRPRRGWCGAGFHVFPARGHVAKRGGVVHFDTEGLTRHHIERRARAVTAVAMLQPATNGGELCVWDLLYDGRDGVEEAQLRATQSFMAPYGVGDAVAIDSFRLHQIQPFAGNEDRVSATIHLAEVDTGLWESWF
jgi:hypothetical protein